MLNHIALSEFLASNKLENSLASLVMLINKFVYSANQLLSFEKKIIMRIMDCRPMDLLIHETNLATFILVLNRVLTKG